MPKEKNDGIPKDTPGGPKRPAKPGLESPGGVVPGAPQGGRPGRAGDQGTAAPRQGGRPEDLIYLLDTNTIAALTSARPNPTTLTKIDRHLGTIALPTVVVSEWLYGTRTIKDDGTCLKRALAFLRSVQVLPFDLEAATHDSDVRHRLGVRQLTTDAVIACTALKHHLIVVTTNLKDFRPFAAAGLQIETW